MTSSKEFEKIYESILQNPKCFDKVSVEKFSDIIQEIRLHHTRLTKEVEEFTTQYKCLTELYEEIVKQYEQVPLIKQLLSFSAGEYLLKERVNDLINQFDGMLPETGVKQFYEFPTINDLKKRIREHNEKFVAEACDTFAIFYDKVIKCPDEFDSELIDRYCLMIKELDSDFNSQDNKVKLLIIQYHGVTIFLEELRKQNKNSPKAKELLNLKGDFHIDEKKAWEMKRNLQALLPPYGVNNYYEFPTITQLEQKISLNNQMYARKYGVSNANQIFLNWENKEKGNTECIGKQTSAFVYHLTYGKGIIRSIKNNTIEVEFANEAENFLFPDCFIKKNGRCLLDVDDDIANISNVLQYFKFNNVLEEFNCVQETGYVSLEENSWLCECIDRYRLLEHIKKKGFIGFLHTTNFSNFESIYSTGRLLSRNKLNSSNVLFTDCAESGIIEGTNNYVKDSNRFYYRTKTPTNYSAFRYKGQENPVIFVLKKEFIYDKSAVFYDGNAGARDSRYTKFALTAMKYYNWNCIFSDVIAYESEETSEFLQKEGCSFSEYKRMKNAEVLFKNEIFLDSFEKIYFRTMHDYKKAIELFGNDNRFVCAPEMFCL